MIQMVVAVVLMVQELGVAERLSQLTESVRTLEKQMLTQQKNYARNVAHAEERVQGVERRQEELADRVSGVERQVDVLQEQQEELVDRIREESKTMMYSMLDKIADQFDGIDAVVKEHAEEQKRLVQRLGKLDDWCGSVEARAEETKEIVVRRLEETREDLTNTVMNTVDEAVSSMRQTQSNIEAEVQGVRLLVEGQGLKIDDGHARMERRIDATDANVDAVVSEWEKKSEALQGKFDSYKAYVSRLRQDVHRLQSDVRDAQDNFVQNVSKELDTTEKNISSASGHILQSMDGVETIS